MHRPRPLVSVDSIEKDAMTILEFAKGKLRRNLHKQHVPVELPTRHQGENSQLMGVVMHRLSDRFNVIVLYVTDKHVWVGRTPS